MREELASRLPPEFRSWHPLNQAQYLETRFLMPGYILSSQGDAWPWPMVLKAGFPSWIIALSSSPADCRWN